MTGVRSLAVSVLVWLAALALPAAAQEEEVLERLFTAETIERNWFSSALLNRANLEEVVSIVRGLKGTLGGYRGVQKEGPRSYTVFLERGRVPAELQLDETGLVTFLFFRQPTAAGLTPQEALGGFVRLERAGGGTVSVLVTQDDSDQVSLSPDELLDVGSAFKLAVLRAVAERIKAGKIAWNDVVSLDDAWRSLPSGILHGWPPGAPVTVQTLSTLMISISDNTAADALMALVGREAVSALLPEQPVLTTAEFFKLKADVNNMRARYRAADASGRLSVLAEIASAPLPEASALDSLPSPEIGWPASVRNLCRLIESVADLPVMHVNPGATDPANWAQIAYKGGSAFGAFNMTTHLVDESGIRWCVAATWNTSHETLDQEAFTAAYVGLIGSLIQSELP